MKSKNNINVNNLNKNSMFVGDKYSGKNKINYKNDIS